MIKPESTQFFVEIVNTNDTARIVPQVEGVTENDIELSAKSCFDPVEVDSTTFCRVVNKHHPHLRKMKDRRISKVIATIFIP